MARYGEACRLARRRPYRCSLLRTKSGGVELVLLVPHDRGVDAASNIRRHAKMAIPNIPRRVPASRIAAPISARGRALKCVPGDLAGDLRGYMPARFSAADFWDSAARSYRIVLPEPTARAGSRSGVSRRSLVFWQRGLRTGEAGGVGVRGQSIRTRAG